MMSNHPENDSETLNVTTILSEREELEAVYRHVFMGETQADIGDVLGVSAGTVGNVVRQARSADADVETAVLSRFTDDEDPRDSEDREHLTAVIHMDEDNESEDGGELVTDGGAVQDASGEQTPTTAFSKGDEYGRIAHAHDDHATRQRCLVGNVREGQVMVDLEAFQHDSDQSAYEGYTGNTWTIANVSEDGHHLTLRKRDGRREGRERRMTVAAFAHEHLTSSHGPGRWMFLKDSRLANTWTESVRTDRPGQVCENCGVNRDVALSREDHFTTTVDGVEYDVTLRRCVGCGMVGTHAKRNSGRSVSEFTTGVLAGPDAPWQSGN